MAKKLPYYPLYVDDFDEDPFVLEMNLQEVGLYQLSLNEAWKRGSIPDDPRALATLIRREPRDVARAWPRVRARFVENGTSGRLVNPRQELERTKAAEKSRKATESVRTRYEKYTNVVTNVDIARARASESLSVSDSGLEVKPSNEEKPSTRALALRCPPELEPPAILEEVRGIYRQGGAPIPDAHENMAVQYLLDIPLEKRARVANYVKWAFVTGKWPSPAKTKSFLNVLRDGDWDVEITPRVLPRSEADKRQRSEESYDNVLRMLEAK